MSEKKCTLSNEDLLLQCEQWVHKLAKSGGKDWCLQVPVNFNRDPDMLFMELINRFKANVQQGNVWVKASDRLAATFLNWLTKDSFLELIAGQWTAKGDEDAKCPFTQERIIELFNESEAKKALEG